MSDDEKKGMMDKWKEKREEKKKKKLIEQIKKKDEMINKNKEDIKKMALELKDGKLVKKEEKTRGVPEQPVQPPQFAQPMQQPVQPQQFAQPMQQPQQQPTVQVQVQQPQYQPPHQYQQQPQQQYQPPQANSPFDNTIESDIPEQQFTNQPVGPTEEFSQEDAMRDIPINFVMLGGLNFQFITKLGGLKQVLTYIAESINNQEVIELGNRLINPRHIVFYEY